MNNPISNYVDKRIDKKLEDLKIQPRVDVQFDENFELDQNKMFYKADTAELVRFFKTRRPLNMLFSTNYFYREVAGNTPILHYPLANMITKSMVNLLFADNPIIELKSGNKARDVKLNKLLNEILDSNDWGVILQEACEMESYSGAVAFKPVIDKEFSEYPILIPYPKEDIDIIEKYNRPVAVVFKDHYKENSDRYELHTICGKGYMKYKLYKESAGRLREVPLSKLEETKTLKDTYFYNRDGSLYDNIVAVYKENKPGAKSDYFNLADDFAALDEIYSNMINYIRKSKIKTYLPENTLKLNVITGEKERPNDYDTDNIILYDANPEGTQLKVERDIVDLNNSIVGYQDAFNNVLLNALMTTGLSPATLGLDIAGANSSALALNIRERTSLRTRAEKQKRWNESLIKLVVLLLDLYNAKEVNGNLYLDTYEGEVTVDFPKYETPTYSEQVQTLSEALNNNLIDLDTALRRLYPDLEDEDIEIMKLNIEGQLPSGEDIEENELNEEDME